MLDWSRLEGLGRDFVKNMKLMEYYIWICWKEIYINEEIFGGELYVEKWVNVKIFINFWKKMGYVYVLVVNIIYIIKIIIIKRKYCILI